MNKQTAVEWLIEQWPILESQLPPWLIEQAKEQERERIIIAHEYGYSDGYIDNGKDGLTYYNETYKGGDNETCNN